MSGVDASYVHLSGLIRRRRKKARKKASKQGKQAFQCANRGVPPFTNASIAVSTHSRMTNGLWSVMRFGSRCGKDGARRGIARSPGAEILCVGCLEKRIGRELAKADFTEVPINSPDRYAMSVRCALGTTLSKPLSPAVVRP